VTSAWASYPLGETFFKKNKEIKEIRKRREIKEKSETDEGGSRGVAARASCI
jgi:hypothetical protein